MTTVLKLNAQGLMLGAVLLCNVDEPVQNSYVAREHLVEFSLDQVGPGIVLTLDE